MREHADLWSEVMRLRAEDLRRDARRTRFGRRTSPRRPLPRREPTER
jgi:hypothetical protein